jgi:hypothetical protein
VSVDREKNWAVDFAVPETLKPGSYILEAYLTVSGSTQSYRARVSLEVASSSPAAPQSSGNNGVH